MKQLIIIGMLLVITGCYTSRRASRQMTKAYTFYPGTVAMLTSKWFPLKESTDSIFRYLPGRIIYDTTMITINCDSLIQNVKTDVNKKKIYHVAIPYQAQRVDTIFVRKDKIVERTSTLDACNEQLKATQQQITEKMVKLAEVRRTLRIVMWVAIAEGLFILIRLLYKLYFSKLL